MHWEVHIAVYFPVKEDLNLSIEEGVQFAADCI